MARKFGAVLAGIVLGWSVVAGAGPAFAAEDPDPFAETCDDNELAEVDLPATCIDGEWVSGGFDDSGFGETEDNFGAFVALIVFLGIFAAGAGVWWRVSTAKGIARRAGMNEGDAATMAAFTDGGLEATYLASQLRSAAPAAATDAQPRDAAARLAELQQLRGAGTITSEEYDAQRRRIIDGI